MLKSNSRRLKILLGADFIATGKTHKRCTSSQFHSSVRKTAWRAEPQHKWFNAIIKTTNHWVLTCFLSGSFYGKWYLEATNLAVTFTLRHLQWMQLPLLLEGSRDDLAQPHRGREFSFLAHCLCGHKLTHLQRLSVPLPRYARPKRKWLLLCNPPLPLELSHGPLEGWLVGAQHRTIGRTPLSVLILAIHKTHGKTCSFLKKKSKQTAHAHRWETCIQKKRKRERECFCLQSSFHLAHDWSKLIWVNVGLWSSHGKPESPFIQSHQGHHCLGGTMHGGHTQPHTLHTPSRKTWAFPKRKWRQTAHCTEIAFVPSCHLEQEPGRSKLRGGR